MFLSILFRFFREENKKLDNEVEKQTYDDVKSLDTEETKYIFRMDWTETFFNEQQPDTKIYPLDQIIARYRKTDSDIDYEEEGLNLLTKIASNS